MAPTLAHRNLLLAAAVTLLLAGCGSWWQQQQRALQQRLNQERCLQQRSAIEQRLAPLRADQQALARIRAERYVPTPKPQPPDAALASRYSLLDQQLDEQRYNDQLDAWRGRESKRQQLWQQSQRQRSEQVKQQLQQHSRELKALDAALVTNDTLNLVRLEQLRRCR